LILLGSYMTKMRHSDLFAAFLRQLGSQ
jgi:hypothetical protein